MDLFLLWVWLRLDALIGILGMMAPASWILAFLSGAIRLTAADERESEAKTLVTKVNSWLTVGAIVATCGLVLVPSSKDVAVMVGYYYGKEALQSPIGQKAQKVLLGKANEILDQELEKLKK